MITRIREVGNPMNPEDITLELQLEQMFDRGFSASSGMTGFFMKGHSSFSPQETKKKTAWQTVSLVQALEQGIISSIDEVRSAPEGKLIPNKPLVLRNSQGQPLDVMLVEVDTFEARRWKDRVSNELRQQPPKKAGAEGDILTYNGRPIYRNTIISTPGMDDASTGRAWNEDLVILHNNVPVGSSVRRTIAEQGLVVGQPAMSAAIVEEGTGEVIPSSTSSRRGKNQE